MNIPCDVIRDLLPLYCDGACSEESRRAVEAHTASCAACREELALMQSDIHAAAAVHTAEKQAAEAAARTWKRSRYHAFCQGCFLLLLVLALLAAARVGLHRLRTVDDRDEAALAQAIGRGVDPAPSLTVEKTREWGDYLVVLCQGTDGRRYLGLFVRDETDSHRWHLTDSVSGMTPGWIDTQKFYVENGELLWVLCGTELPEAAQWYQFQQDGVTYTCPIYGDIQLDVFAFQREWFSPTFPTVLDEAMQPIA